ncbi:MAG: hypothetical protein GY796_16600 [Chloroflexi bacterium]|nr:hypothetical protein [Chloroflexota bacterium]
MMMHTQLVGNETSKVQENGRFLRRVLRGNAVFSLLSAALFILAANPLAEFLGVPYSAAFMVMGVGFLPFGWFCYWTANQPEISRTRALIILELDLVWVVGSFLILFFGWLPLTTAGKWAVGLTAEAVAVFAILEFIGLRQLKK